MKELIQKYDELKSAKLLKKNSSKIKTQKNIMLLINQSKFSTYLYYNSVTGKVMNRL